VIDRGEHLEGEGALREVVRELCVYPYVDPSVGARRWQINLYNNMLRDLLVEC